jgi:ArsR family transcriptional regulator
MNVSTSAALAPTPADAAFAALGERGRVRLACCLLEAAAGLCVCELVDALAESQPNVSRDLKVLKDAGLVDERREGRWVYHRLRDPNDPILRGIRSCLDATCCCGDVQQDLSRLRRRLELRVNGKCVVGLRPTRT